MIVIKVETTLAKDVSSKDHTIMQGARVNNKSRVNIDHHVPIKSGENIGKDQKTRGLDRANQRYDLKIIFMRQEGCVYEAVFLY